MRTIDELRLARDVFLCAPAVCDPRHKQNCGIAAAVLGWVLGDTDSEAKWIESLFRDYHAKLEATKVKPV